MAAAQKRMSRLFCVFGVKKQLTDSRAADFGPVDDDGFVLEKARRRKETRSSELGHHGTRLVVLACEVGGRFSQEA